MYYIDTSALVAYYCPEPLSREIQDLLGQQGKPALSALTEVEMYSAVARKVRMEELDKSDGQRILAMFAAHVDAELFQMVYLEKHHWKLAKGWIGLFSTPLRTLDALHLAVVSAESLELVTSDRLMHQCAGMLGLKANLLSV